MSEKYKNDANENTSIDASMSGGEVPQKESVVGKFLESFIQDMGIFSAIDVGLIALRKEESKITKKDFLGKLGFNTVVSALFALYKGYEAAEHNKDIDALIKQEADSHAQRYKQEKLVNSQSPQTPSRM